MFYCIYIIYIYLHMHIFPMCIYMCIYTLHFASPLIYQWIFEMLSLGYYEQRCFEHKYENISVRPCFQLFCYTLSGIAESCASYILSFSRNLHCVLQSNCIILHSHQQCTRPAIVPHSHQHLLYCFCFLYSHYLNGCEQKRFCGLNLHLSDDD